MQRNFVAFDALFIQALQHPFGEMQASCRRSHRTLHLAVHRLIRFQVAGLRITVQVWRDRQFADSFEHLGKGHLVVVPAEHHFVSRAAHSLSLGSQRQFAFAHRDAFFQFTLFPLFQVTDEASPRHAARGCKILLIVERRVRFEAEHLNQRTGRFIKVQTRLNHLGIVEHHEFTLFQVVRQVIEHVLFNFAFAVNQQFRFIAVCFRVFSDAFIGQRVVIVRNMNVFRVLHDSLFILVQS